MVVRRAKKVSKYRSHTTHGGGHRKKRRGAGSRGGRGRAGTGKRAGHKRKGVKLGSKKGFVPRNTEAARKPVINVNYFTALRLAGLEKKGKVTKEGSVYVVNLAALKLSKVLGTGAIEVAVKVIGECSPKAAEKITAAGGSVVSPQDSSSTAKEEEAKE